MGESYQDQGALEMDLRMRRNSEQSKGGILKKKGMCLNQRGKEGLWAPLAKSIVCQTDGQSRGTNLEILACKKGIIAVEENGTAGSQVSRLEGAVERVFIVRLHFYRMGCGS